MFLDTRKSKVTFSCVVIFTVIAFFSGLLCLDDGILFQHFAKSVYLVRTLRVLTVVGSDIQDSKSTWATPERAFLWRKNMAANNFTGTYNGIPVVALWLNDATVMPVFMLNSSENATLACYPNCEVPTLYYAHDAYLDPLNYSLGVTAVYYTATAIFFVIALLIPLCVYLLKLCNKDYLPVKTRSLVNNQVEPASQPKSEDVF